MRHVLYTPWVHHHDQLVDQLAENAGVSGSNNERNRPQVGTKKGRKILSKTMAACHPHCHPSVHPSQEMVALIPYRAVMVMQISAGAIMYANCGFIIRLCLSGRHHHYQQCLLLLCCCCCRQLNQFFGGSAFGVSFYYFLFRFFSSLAPFNVSRQPRETFLPLLVVVSVTRELP